MAFHRGWTHSPWKNSCATTTTITTARGYCIVEAWVPMTTVPVPRSFSRFDSSHLMPYRSAQWPRSHPAILAPTDPCCPFSTHYSAEELGQRAGLTPCIFASCKIQLSNVQTQPHASNQHPKLDLRHCFLKQWGSPASLFNGSWCQGPQACHNDDHPSINVNRIALASVLLIRLLPLTYLSSSGSRYTVFPGHLFRDTIANPARLSDPIARSFAESTFLSRCCRCLFGPGRSKIFLLLPFHP